MYKEQSPPEIIYSGLKRLIGSPKEIEKNLASEAYFDNEFDLQIPLSETLQYEEL